jgi:outer membrane protein W
VTIDGVEVGAPYSRGLSWTNPGEFTVVARVTDDEGQTAESSVTIRVVSPRGWTLRGFLSGVRFDDDITRRVEPGPPVTQSFNYLWESGWGLGLEAEYRFSDRLGLAGGLFWSEGDVELMWDTPTSWEMDFDSWDTTSLFVGPMFHPLRRDRRVDFFIGPVLHYTQIGSLFFDLPSRDVREELDDELSYGAQLGVDIGLARDGRVGLHVGGLWLDLDGEAEYELEDESTEADSLYEVSISPLTLNVGFFYRFR